MKLVYCANCGTRLAISRKALPKFATIIDIVEHHECTKDPVPLDLEPSSVPTVGVTGRFVDEVSKLQTVPEPEPGDLRAPEHVKSDIKSTAPKGLLNQMKNMVNSTPDKPLPEEEDKKKGK